MRPSRIHRLPVRKATVPLARSASKPVKDRTVKYERISSFDCPDADMGWLTPARCSTKPQAPTAPTLPRRANPLLLNVKSESRQPKPRRTVPPKALAFFGMGVLVVGIYSGSLYASYKQETARSQNLAVPEDVSDRYNRTAGTFDAEVDASEKIMRMGTKRRDLVRMARGDVLEVSCGTGRNVEYYDLGHQRARDDREPGKSHGCGSITFVDLSPQMVEITRQKFTNLHPDFKHVAFQVQDAGKVLPPAALPAGSGADKQQTQMSGPRYYDTIVQTMGLCSMPNPVAVLQHLGSITEPENGRILLLEHGRSYYGWLNRILDNLAPAHADKHGCWWNRDIGKIVEKSGLEVVESKRWHLGTTWKFVLRPTKAASAERPPS